VAAVLAIVALAAALVAMLFALVRGEPWRIPAAMVAIGVAVVGLWYAVACKGLARIGGAAVAVISLGAVLALTLSAPFHGLLLILSLALVVASAAAARYALESPGIGADSVGVSATMPPRPIRPVLLMNPKSGGGKVARFGLVEECRKRGIESVLLKPGDDLRALAEQAISRGCNVIGMAGGDGSQALVASVASQHGVAHVVVPAGTRNHFALDLGLDRDDVVGALDAFTDGVEQRVDLARVNGRIFVNNASLGLYATIVQSDAYRDAKLKTTASMLPDLLGPDARPFDLRYKGPDGTPFLAAHLILVSNDPYQLDHLGGMGTRSRIDRGTLGIVAVRIGGAAEAATFTALEAAGRIRSFPGWMEWSAPRFDVGSDGPIEIAIDGEALRMDPPLRFESLPGALKVRLPKTVGRSPAAEALPLTASTWLDLARVAVGASDRATNSATLNGKGGATREFPHESQ
jgi:diacylglycerol kinase family enzyme